MNRSDVDYSLYIPQLLHSLTDGGALLVSMDKRQLPNAMTIGWAQIGIIWGLPILSVMVRPSRYTYSCIEATGDFSVCVPYAAMREQVDFCGSESGRRYDKFAECGFTALPGKHIISPTIGECGLSYECKVVHFNDVLVENLAASVCDKCYAAGDFHRIYFGEILCTGAADDFAATFGLAQ